MSERQVVLFITCCKIHRSGRRRRERSTGSRSRLRSTHTLNLPCADTVKPSSLPFACIDIERNGQFFAQLDVELADFIFTEYVETHSARILVMCFNDILLNLPWVSCF